MCGLDDGDEDEDYLLRYFDGYEVYFDRPER